MSEQTNTQQVEAIFEAFGRGDIPFILDQLDRASLGHNTFAQEALRLIIRSREGLLRRTRESGLPLEKTFATLQLIPFGPRLTQQIEQLRRGTFVAGPIQMAGGGGYGGGGGGYRGGGSGGGSRDNNRGNTRRSSY